MARVKGQSIPSALAELYEASLGPAVPRSGKSANTYASFKYNEGGYRAGYAIRQRTPFKMPYRRGKDEVNAATLAEIETTNDYQGHVEANDGISQARPLRRGRPSAKQLYCRNIFKKAANCWHYQPWTGDYIADAEAPRPKTWWYTSAAPDSPHYYNYFMGETMGAWHSSGKPLWCIGVIKYAVIVDFGQYNIQSFNYKYNYTWKIGEEGAGDGDFLAPRSVKIYNGLIYVLDSDKANVQIFNVDGDFLSKFGTQGTGVGEMYSPRSMAMGYGKVYISDPATHKVLIFTTSGTFVDEFGTEGIGDGEFKDNEGVHCAFGKVYVSDYVRKDVQIFSPAGGFESSFNGSSGDAGAFSGPTGITSTANKIIVADAGESKIKIYNYDGSDGYKFQHPNGDDVVITRPHEILARFGVYWFPVYNNIIKVYFPNGVLAAEFPTHGDQPGQTKSPVSIDIIPG